MSNPEELVVFMTLPFSVDESIIPGALTSRGIPVYLSERFLAHQGRYVEIRGFEFRLRALKMLCERPMTQNG